VSKRKENAGAGYGYMFHGSFKNKADAVAKEKKTPGSWVKSVYTNSGFRYMVMSPRTNPIKRKAHGRAQNPAKNQFWEKFTREEQRWLAKLKFKKQHFTSDQDVQHAKQVLAQMEETRRRYGINPTHLAPPKVSLYMKVSAITGKKIGKATKVTFSDGREVKFLERLAKRVAIEAAEKELGRNNPHELLILGANPTVHPAGGVSSYRHVNPVNPDRYTSAHAIASGASYQAPGLIRTKRQARVAGMVRGARKHKYEWIPAEGIAPGQNPGDDRYMYAAAAELYPGRQLGQLTAGELSQVAQRAAQLKLQATAPRHNVELGTFENGVFHPWTRRPKSRQKKAIRRQNTSAGTLREEFTGTPWNYYTVQTEPHVPAGDYALLGKLLALHVKPAAGGQVQAISFRSNHPAVLSDESARQIYFVDGDQDVSESLAVFGARDRGAGVFELGEAKRIDYKQRKTHVPDPEADEWRHEFGEETGVRPVLFFDRPKKRLLLEGGEYEIRREGITN
jgi:hypothetical protein